MGIKIPVISFSWWAEWLQYRAGKWRARQEAADVEQSYHLKCGRGGGHRNITMTGIINQNLESNQVDVLISTERECNREKWNSGEALYRHWL